MQILYIIGNGFDLNLGLKTRYTDFYQYYHSIKSTNESIIKLKNHLKDNFHAWSDMEKAFGDYTDFISDDNEFDEIFDDLGEELAKYISAQEAHFTLTNLNVDNFVDSLCFPESRLARGDRNTIYAFKDRWKNRWFVNIITLNYTRTLEKFIGDNTSNLRLKNHNDTSIFLKGLEHLHGYTDDRMIFGVNDISQLKNTSFHDNQNVTEAIVKLNCNKALRHTIDEWSVGKIKAANLICIFGCSIGETDKFWWEQIGQRLREDCLLIIFDKVQDIPSRVAYKKTRKEREMVKKFLAQTNLSESEIEEIKPKIFIGINTEMFKV